MLFARTLPVATMAAAMTLTMATAASADTGSIGSTLATIAAPIQVQGFRLASSAAVPDMAKLDARGLAGIGVFADDGGNAMLSRARFLGFAPWGTALTLEMSRSSLAPRRTWGSIGWKAGAKLRLLASKAMDGGALVLGIGAGFDRRKVGGLPSRTDKSYSSSRSLEFGWVSEDHWRLTLGYQGTSGGSGRRSGSRMIDLAAGAPIHEHGPRLTLAFADRASPVSYGLLASSGKLSTRDAIAMGSSTRSTDNRASLFWLTRF